MYEEEYIRESGVMGIFIPAGTSLPIVHNFSKEEGRKEGRKFAREECGLLSNTIFGCL